MTQTPLWLPKPTIVGTAVVLRPFIPDDVFIMAEILADPEVLTLTGSVNSTAEVRDHVDPPDATLRDWYATRAEADERLDLAIIDRAAGHLVGEVVLNEFDPASLSVNFRTLIGPAGRNRGLGTEATRLILEYGFTTLGLHRVGLDVFSNNPRAQRVYEKVGFVVEGRKRDAFAFDGAFIDEIWMSILEDEWARHHGYPT